MLEKAKVVVGRHSDKVESRGRQVDGKDEWTTWTRAVSLTFQDVESHTHGSANDDKMSR